MTNFPPPVGGSSGVDKSAFITKKTPSAPQPDLAQNIAQLPPSSQSIKGKGVKLDATHSKGSLHLLKDPSAAVTDSIGGKVIHAKESSATVYKLKDGWFVKLRRALSPVTWYKRIKSLAPFKEKPPVSTKPIKTAQPKQPVHKAITPMPTTPAYDLLAKTLAKGPIKSIEIMVMVEQLHDEFLQGPQQPEVATALHVIEEKAAAKLEAMGQFKEACEIRALAATIPLYKGHPLANVKGPPFGTHCPNLDSGVVKGGNVQGIVRLMDTGTELPSFTFKISHPARDKLAQTLQSIEKDPAALKMSAPKGFEDISVKKDTMVFLGKNDANVFSKQLALDTYDPTTKISFNGKGHVIVGANKGNICLYNNIVVEVDPSVPKEERLQTAHAMVSMLGLGPVFGKQRPEDNERIKIAQLYRAYYPRAAYKMERKADFYEMPVDELKKQIAKNTSAMKKRWGELDTMVEEEIYPGKKVWCVPTLADQMRKKGAMGLLTGINDYTIDRCADTVCRILRDGALSSQDRYQHGVIIPGQSTSKDFTTGGADTVFTRLVTENIEAKRTQAYSLKGSVQILWDLDVVNRGSYGYQYDNYGTRGISSNGKKTTTYQNRSNLVELTSKINKYETGNEVMVKNRIDPRYMRGLVVQSEEDRDVLIKKLYEANLVDSQGCINGKPVEQFVRFAFRFKYEMWSPK